MGRLRIHPFIVECQSTGLLKYLNQFSHLHGDSSAFVDHVGPGQEKHTPPLAHAVVLKSLLDDRWIAGPLNKNKTIQAWCLSLQILQEFFIPGTPQHQALMNWVITAKGHQEAKEEANKQKALHFASMQSAAITELTVSAAQLHIVSPLGHRAHCLSSWTRI